MLREPFSAGNSQVHRLDPRLKIIFTTVFSFTVALSRGFPALTGAFLLSCLLVGLSRLNLREVAKRIALVNGLILLFWVVLPLTYGGDPLFFAGPLAVSREGVWISARMTLRSNAILLAFMAMVASISIATLGHALHRLGFPRKLVHLFLMTYRYVFVIEQEYQRLSKAAKVRGFMLKTNMHTYKSLAYFMGMLFVRASARADRVHQAMLCRGFKGRFYCLRGFAVTQLDAVWSVFMSLSVIGLAGLEWLAMAPS